MSKAQAQAPPAATIMAAVVAAVNMFFRTREGENEVMGAFLLSIRNK